MFLRKGFASSFLSANDKMAYFSKLTEKCISRFYTSSTKTRIGIPFKIDLIAAHKLFSEDSSYFDHGTDLFPGKQTNPNLPIFYDSRNTIKAHYLPFHSLHIRDLTTSYCGRYGIDHYYTDWVYADNKLTPVIRCVTYWYDIAGTSPTVDYDIGSPITQVFASFRLPRLHVENVMANTICAKRINDLIDLDINFDNDTKINQTKINHTTINHKKTTMNGVNAEFFPFEMKTNFALKQATDRVLAAECSRVKNYVKNKYSADHVEIDITMKLDTARIFQIHSYYLPAFVHQQSFIGISELGKIPDPVAENIGNLDNPNDSDHKNKRYKILNAETKSLSGPRIISTFKVGGLTGTLIGLSTLGLLSPLGPYGIGLTAAQIVGRAAIGMVASGTAAGLLTKMSNSYKFWRDRRQIAKDMEMNKQFNSEKHDEKIGYNDPHEQKLRIEKETKEKLNKDPEGKKYLHSNYCYLLALDSRNPISEKELKEAYHLQVRKWHPDSYQGDKQMADLMTKEINEAYSILSQQFRN